MFLFDFNIVHACEGLSEREKMRKFLNYWLIYTLHLFCFVRNITCAGFFIPTRDKWMFIWNSVWPSSCD